MPPRYSFDLYKANFEGIAGYSAGLPGYKENFTRDSLLAGIIATDRELIESQLHLSTLHQGKQNDPVTGEEPGKIHHQYPGVPWREPLLTTYNACDTSGLYVLGFEILKKISPRASADFIHDRLPNIRKATDYVISHTKDNIFWEYPPDGADRFCLRHTYWKDSIPPYASGKEEPVYPVAFALAQFQNARGILAAGRLLNDKDLLQLAHDMFVAGIAHFMTEKAFCVEEDAEGRLELPSSDELHSLAYIPEKYWAYLPAAQIEARALHLITPVGIACTPREIHERLSDQYHGYVVWIFEQALIHYGVRKFGMRDLAQLTKECAVHIDTGHELLSVMPEIRPMGNTHQLWSVAAGIYFSEKPSLRQTNWL